MAVSHHLPLPFFASYESLLCCSPPLPVFVCDHHCCWLCSSRLCSAQYFLVNKNKHRSLKAKIQQASEEQTTIDQQPLPLSNPPLQQQQQVEEEEVVVGETNESQIEERENQRLPSDEYEVEELLDRRSCPSGTLFYKVKWRGYSSEHDSWEPEYNILDADLILNYEAKIAARKKEESAQNYTCDNLKRTRKAREMQHHPPPYQLEGESENDNDPKDKDYHSSADSGSEEEMVRPKRTPRKRRRFNRTQGGNTTPTTVTTADVVNKSVSLGHFVTLPAFEAVVYNFRVQMEAMRSTLAAHQLSFKQQLEITERKWSDKYDDLQRKVQHLEAANHHSNHSSHHLYNHHNNSNHYTPTNNISIHNSNGSLSRADRRFETIQPQKQQQQPSPQKPQTAVSDKHVTDISRNNDSDDEDDAMTLLDRYLRSV